jgi:hypothetical protein
MKKVILFFLLLAGTANILHAQQNNYATYMQGFYVPGATQAEQIFSIPQPGKLRVNFRFFYVDKSMIITLEFANIKQLNHLPNLDSVFASVKNNLKFMADSLKQDGIVRRIDYVHLSEKRSPQIRILSHENLLNNYVIKNNELQSLKVEQDTLRIKQFAVTGDSIKYYNGDKKTYHVQSFPFFIMITVNNINDIYKLSDTVLSQCANRLQQEVTNEYVNKADKKASYTASFNMQTNKMFSPYKTKYIKYGWRQHELVPNIYGGLQFVRGSFVPSMAAGLRYTFPNGNISSMHLYAMWEPYFFFSRDVNNKLITDRNDFVTLRFLELDRGKKEGFDLVNNFSIGYLVGRKGDWFEPNTFKVGIPGIRSGWLQLEPEFIFNDWFKNFSPSIKLTIHYE